MKQTKTSIQKYILSLLRSSSFAGFTMLLVFSTMPFSLKLNAQENVLTSTKAFQIKGIVRDAFSKQPLNAAQVVSLSSANSAVTDSLGHFVIGLDNKEEIISVNAYDYNIRQVAVRGKDSLIIDLYHNTFANYYLPVDGLNGKAERINSVRSQANSGQPKNTFVLSADELIHTALGANLRSVKRSGVSGMGAVMFLRGLNSINANAQPLFVVDGVIWNVRSEESSVHYGYIPNPLDVIDANDIEDVTLLKNGTAIYGSKAANGVILIKTKRGTGTVTKIDLNITTGMTTTPKSIPVMNATQHLNYVSEVLKTSGLTPQQLTQLPFFNDDPARSTYLAYHNNTDWADQVYTNGWSKDYSINVNGGDEKAQYYLSLGYTGNTGVVKPTNMDRYNIRLNSDVNLFSNAKLAVNVGFSRIDRDMIDDGVNATSSPTWISRIKSPILFPYNYTTLGGKTDEFTYYDVFGIGNPGGVIKYANNTFKKNSFNITLHPEFTINKNLRISEHFDYNISKTNEDYYRPYLFSSPVMLQGKGLSYNARMSQIIRNSSIYSDTRADYNLVFDNSKLDVFGGIRYIFNSYESDYVEGHNSLSNSTVNLPGNFKFLRTDGINDLYKSLAYYANASYNLKEKYFADLALSMDGSSRFGSETKSGFQLFGHSWGVFPSLNMGWLMSSESFMQSAESVDLLKLRAGLSLTGNDDVPNYLNQVYFTSIRFKDGANGAVLNGLRNPEIQWETNLKADIGADINLFNDRLSVVADVYYSKTDNLLNMRQLNEIGGVPYYWANGGSLQNLGGELSLTWKVLNSRNFGWETGLSLGTYKNKITALPADIYNRIDVAGGGYTTELYNAEILTAVGLPAGVFYGYKTHGVFATEADAQNAGLKLQNNDGSYSYFKAGDVIFDDVADANGVKDGVIDQNDKQVIGDPNPDFYGSLTNKFSYKGFTLSVLLTGSYGNDLYNYQRSQLESGLDLTNQSAKLTTRWTGEGQITTQPKAILGDPMGNARFSDRWIEDGSYIRLKNITLDYDLDLKLNFIQKINIWVAANNMLTLTNYLGPDPEFAAGNSVLVQGIDNGLLPQSQSFFVGLKINL